MVLQGWQDLGEDHRGFGGNDWQQISDIGFDMRFCVTYIVHSTSTFCFVAWRYLEYSSTQRAAAAYNKAPLFRCYMTFEPRREEAVPGIIQYDSCKHVHF